MTWDEFLDITLAQLEALEERRAIAIRYDRFNAALITSAIVNANRAADSEAVLPFDFLSGFERDPEEEEREAFRKSVKHSVALAFTQMKGLSRDAVLAEKAAMVARMEDNGVDDAEELIREVFPDL